MIYLKRKIIATTVIIAAVWSFPAKCCLPVLDMPLHFLQQKEWAKINGRMAAMEKRRATFNRQMASMEKRRAAFKRRMASMDK